VLLVLSKCRHFHLRLSLLLLLPHHLAANVLILLLLLLLLCPRWL
jgi:hypothetical protein